MTSSQSPPSPERRLGRRLGGGVYQGFQGGLQPGGVNTRPAARHAAGLAEVERVVPRNGTGAPDPNERIVHFSIGTSNTSQEFSALIALPNADPEMDPRVLLVNGAPATATGPRATPRSRPPGPLPTPADVKIVVHRSMRKSRPRAAGQETSLLETKEGSRNLDAPREAHTLRE